jgi:hypothetical protein
VVLEQILVHAVRTIEGVSQQPFEPDSVLWSLHSGSGDQLTCEIRRTDVALCLQFRSNAGVVRVSQSLDPASVESWSRVWRAYYLTSGWSDQGRAPRRHRQRAGRTPAAAVQADGPKHRNARAHPDRPPVITGAILRCWSVRGTDGATVVCELVRTEAGLEVRCDTSPVRTRLVNSIGEGINLANVWKAAYENSAVAADAALE